MVSKGRQDLFDFIDKIPEGKLMGFRNSTGLVYSDRDFRLDMQGLTTSDKSYNLQIQANKGTKITTLKKVAPKTVSHVIVPADAEWTADELRAKFKAASRI